MLPLAHSRRENDTFCPTAIESDDVWAGDGNAGDVLCNEDSSLSLRSCLRCCLRVKSLHMGHFLRSSSCR
jgi:hypothetical protein